MKKRIEQLLNGKFKYEQPELLFSQDKIEVTLKAGDTFRENLYLGAEDDIFQQEDCAGNRTVFGNYRMCALRH